LRSANREIPTIGRDDAAALLEGLALMATEHRHVTEEMRDRVYSEYSPPSDSGCCQVDHLVALEQGGPSEIRNLWRQPDDPKPGAGEKGQLANELHERVCSGKMRLADAQRCIASNWVLSFLKT
jgi:hypothetical protein